MDAFARAVTPGSVLSSLTCSPLPPPPGELLGILQKPPHVAPPLWCFLSLESASCLLCSKNTWFFLDCESLVGRSYALGSLICSDIINFVG